MCLLHYVKPYSFNYWEEFRKTYRGNYTGYQKIYFGEILGRAKSKFRGK